MNITKANNRFFGQFFEQAVVSVVNSEEIINDTEYSFSSEEIDTMTAHAIKLAKEVKANQAVWVGKATSNESCDVKLDNKEVELKYVGSGSGTYFNTSMDYVTLLGFPSYHEVLEAAGYIETLVEYFGDIVSLENTSPVSNANSKLIRKQYPDVYSKLSKWENKIRRTYVKSFFNFLLNNPNERAIFISDMISKNASGKHIPDELIIFNHNTEEITSLTKNDLTSFSKNDIIELSGCSIKFGNAKATFAWQNGTGLNNPTIRVFI